MKESHKRLIDFAEMFGVPIVVDAETLDSYFDQLYRTGTGTIDLNGVKITVEY